MHLQLDGDAREGSLESACEGNRWVRDEDVILEPVDSVTGVLKDERVVLEEDNTLFVPNILMRLGGHV
jgi:hypothetical protein